MKSLMLLWKKVADELATGCCTDAHLDFVKTVEPRVKHEGLSFLTITLPSFGKDFERSLDLGKVDHDAFASFKRWRGLPRFLGGFLDQVFDRNDGVLLDTPSIEAIQAVRQLTLIYGKILIPCSDARVEKAMKGFIQCEHDVHNADCGLSDRDRSDFRRVSALLFAGALAKVDREVYNNELLPKHGPGATADNLRGNAKYRQSTWPARLEKILPSGEYLLPNWRYYRQMEAMDIVEPGQEIPVRVTPVPKTLKTPRIIAIEPTAMQYAQQAILGSLLEALGDDPFLHRVIGFRDQTPNQRMAMVGSREGKLATLDLSEASDRVSNLHVLDLFANHPHASEAVQASRSTKADVPIEDGKVIHLNKFASMGSALCFPVEAMVFTTLIFMGIERALSTRLDRRTLCRFKDQVRVYGDDLIVPVEYVREVTRTLEAFGLKVNYHKSFWTGRFRESCGKEYYDGQDVSVVKVRRVLPSSSRDAEEVISLVSLRNQLYFAGLWQTVRWLDEVLTKMLRHFPTVLPTSPLLGRHSFLGYYSEKSDVHLHSPVVRGWKVSAKPPSDELDGEAALLKCLLMMERRDRKVDELGHVDRMPTVDTEHLMRSGRPRVVNIKLVTGSAV